MCAWINYSVNNLEAGDLRRHHAHNDVTALCNQWWGHEVPHCGPIWCYWFGQHRIGLWLAMDTDGVLTYNKIDILIRVTQKILGEVSFVGCWNELLNVLREMAQSQGNLGDIWDLSVNRTMIQQHDAFMFPVIVLYLRSRSQWIKFGRDCRCTSVTTQRPLDRYLVDVDTTILMVTLSAFVM